jgi:hypothetical protein
VAERADEEARTVSASRRSRSPAWGSSATETLTTFRTRGDPLAQVPHPGCRGVWSTFWYETL